MTSVIQSSTPPILPFQTKDVAVDANGVLFSNFVVNSTQPLPSHRDFIRDGYVKWLILQIDKLGYKDKSVEIHVYGNASATGTKTGNLALSDGRAKAIGQIIKEQFDAQKSASSFAKGMTVVIKAHADGDDWGWEMLRREMEQGRHHTDAGEIENLEFSCRSAYVRLSDSHVVDDDDEIYLCQQVYTAKLDTKKVPATELEKLFDDTEDKLGTVGTWLAKYGLGKLKDYVVKKLGLKKMVESLFEDFPEVEIVYQTIDFIVPSDLFLCFRFKDSLGKIAQYQFTGSANKKSIDMFEALTGLISVFRWLTKIDEALKKADDLAKGADKLKDVVGKVKDATGYVKKALDDLLDKNGWVRKYCGDDFADTMLSLMQAGVSGPLVIEASDWYRVVFVSPSVYSVDSFGGTARTETREFLGKAKVDLEFLGAGPEGRLGFGAETIIHGKFTVQTGLLGYGISRGRLNLMRAA